MTPYFNIIQSLCRACFSSDLDVIIHQIERLISAYRADGNIDEAKALEKMLNNAKNKEVLHSSVITFSSCLHGEILTPKTIIPVDKETSAPILDVIHVDELPSTEPIFDTFIREAVNSVILEWSNYDKLIQMNATPSRSCLIYGLPGTGKTHLAKWIAKQLGLPIVQAKLDGIVSSFLGTSSRNIGNLFAFANRYKCILLLDEFDAIAKLRNDPQEVGEVKRIVNTLLQCLDSRDEIGFTIGVTNHEQLLDPAIWRRFDVQIEIPKPSPSIIPLLLQNFISPLKYNEAEISFLSWCLQDCSGADIQKLSNWLKRMSIIDEYKNECLYHLMQRYTLLNTGRISDKVKEIITKAPDDIYASLKASSPELKQKDIAEIFNMKPSSFCKMIQKIINQNNYMANFPVQVILDSDKYIQEVLPHPGGSRKDFYSGKNELFSSHKERITTQLDSVSAAFSENQYSSIGYTKVRLITNAWAKSHRPLGKIFTANNGCTMVGGLRQGEMLVRLSAESASLIKNGIIEHAEDEPRRSPNKEGILMDRPSEWRCEVGTIDSIIPYGAEDKLKITSEDIRSWIEKYGTCQLLIELFDKPIPQQDWDTLMEEEYKLQSSFINGLKTHAGLCIYRSKILSSDTKFILLLTDKEDVTISLFDSIQHNSTSEVTHNIEKYVSLLEFISGHPIVKSIDIVPIVESHPIPSFNINGTEELIIPQPSAESDYPTIAVVDTGISAIYTPWIVDDWDNISVNMRDTTHGTFITGLLVNGQLLNSASVCQDPDGCKIVDLCMLPQKDKFSSVYPNSLDDFLGELNVAIPTILSRTDVRIFNLSMNICCTRLSSDYGEFAKALDELAVKYNIVFVISAGNLITSRPEWSDNPIDNITEWNKRDDDIVYMPAESCRNISVGALNPTNNGLTSYSCRGKGSTLTVKPDFVHIGGLGYIDPEIGTGLYSVDNNSNITYNCGTSFSAPLVAKTMALVEKQIEGIVSRETLIALMVQNSHIPYAFDRPEYRTMLKELIGYGMPTSAHKILNGDEHSINLVFASRIKPKKEMVFEFMWPQCLIRNNKCYGDVKITLVSTPTIDYNYGDEMIRGNLNVTLSQTKDNGTSQYYLKPLYKDETVREHGEYEWQLINENMKWQPIKVYHKEFKRGTTHYSPWKLRVSREDRDFNVVDNEGIPFTIIMTISDTSLEANVYDEIRQTLVAQGVQISDIQTAARITQRI